MSSNEAAGIPNLLVAPKPPKLTEDGIDRSIYDEGGLDERGFYTEGAYIRAPESDPSDDFGLGEQQTAQAAYFQSLLDRFNKLHGQLETRPPKTALDRLDDNHQPYHSGSRDDSRKWRWRLFNTDPLPAQLASMDKATVFKLLKFILNDKGALGAKAKVTNRLSRWIWGLLAKVPVRGELTSEEVGLIRDIGKRAVYLCVEMRGINVQALYAEAEEGGEAAAMAEDTPRGPIIGPVMQEEAVDEEKQTVSEQFVADEPSFQMSPDEVVLGEGKDQAEPNTESAQVAAMKARLLARLDDGAADTIGDATGTEDSEAAAQAALEEEKLQENAKITVDMIITVAGEAYGQRDLLEFREEW